MVNIVGHIIELKSSKNPSWNIWLKKAFILALVIQLETNF